MNIFNNYSSSPNGLWAIDSCRGHEGESETPSVTWVSEYFRQDIDIGQFILLG